MNGFRNTPADGSGIALAPPAFRIDSVSMTRIAIPMLLVGWAAAVSGGFALLLRYKTTPGEADRAPVLWPRTSRLQGPSAGQAALVLFAHPQCPCTQASVSELARLMASVPGQLTLQVVIVRPSGVTENWAETELERRAASIPGAVVIRDDGGTEAERFRAAVSGFALLYDGQGRLRFAGGITPSRGHEGDSFGRRRILAVLSGQSADRDDAPVFGCALGISPSDARFN
jgi:hypothetical protein